MYRIYDIQGFNLSETRLYLFRLVGVLTFLFSFNCLSICEEKPALPLISTPQSYTFNEIKHHNGSSIRNVRDLLQDQRGYIWMASDHGLIRYDGHDFKIFRHSPNDDNSIVDNELLSVYMLGDTLLCVGAVHGVSLIDIRNEKIRNIENDTEGKPVNYVDDFYVDTNGKIWLAGLDGLYSLKPDFSGIVNHYLNAPPPKKGNPAFAKRAYCITQHVSDKNLLMIGTEGGLVSFDIKRNKLHKFYPNEKATFWLSLSYVYKFITDGNYLWTQTWMSGFPRFDMINECWENFVYPNEKTNSNIFAMSDFYITKNKEMWICDVDKGIYTFDKETNSIKPHPGFEELNPVIKNSGLRIFRQRDSTLWLANDNGLWMQNRKAKQFRSLDIPYEFEWVMPTYHDEATNDYYFGLVWQAFGVACWNANQKKWSFLKTETNQELSLNTYSIIKDHKGVIWMGMQGRGLWYVDKKNNLLRKFTLPDDDEFDKKLGTIFRVFEDSKKNLWIGTGTNGVVKLNKERTKASFYKHNPSDERSLIDGTHFKAIAEDKHGNIWLGNYKGFCLYNSQKNHFSQEIPEQLYKTGVRAGYTYSIVKDTASCMWMTIMGQGLVKISEKDNKYAFKLYQTENGLKDLTAMYMTTDPKGGLWIVNNGLLYFNPYDETFMMVDEHNGLVEKIGGDAQIMVDKYGNVFSGEQVGVNWLTEAQKYSVSNISNLIIEEVLVNGKPIEWHFENKNFLSLSEFNHQTNLTFKYTAICYDDYDQVRYRYKLIGLETEWSPPTKVLEARYTNLQAGKYSFVVDVAYKGNWLGLNQYVDFRIRPAFYKTWWFITLMLLFSFSVLYAIYSYRKRQLDEKFQIRHKIASDLHDDVGSTLSSISIMSDILQSQVENRTNAKEMIREIGFNARNMLESMDDIIWSVTPINDSFENLVARIQEYAVPLFESKDISFKFTVPHSILQMSIPIEKRHDLFLIAKETVNNLVKHSQCTEANIEFSASRAVLKMRISDNGKGFDTSRNFSRNGLKNMKYRSEKIGGKLTIHSEIDKGTIVMLVVRVR